LESVIYSFAAGFLAASAEFFQLKLKIKDFFYMLRKYGAYSRQRQPGNVGNYIVASGTEPWEPIVAFGSERVNYGI